MSRKEQFTVPGGIRHATINGHRYHLRLGGPAVRSLLWIDGQSPPLVLDAVAADFVSQVIEAMWEHQQGAGDETAKVREQVVRSMHARYGSLLALPGRRVSRKRIAGDLDRIFGTLLAVAEGRCAIEAGLEVHELSQEEWTAPARMDLAVTYRCNLDCPHCYAGGPRQMAELPLADWRRIYELLWQAGVPQVVFTGGEPTLRDDLLELIREAEEFVTGLVTNGLLLERLAEPLTRANLDYVQVTLESSDPAVHNRMVGAGGSDAHAATVAGLRRALEVGLEVVTNTTLTEANADGFGELLSFGREIGLRTMACNALICSGRGKAARAGEGLGAERLQLVLSRAEQRARELGLNLQWYTPTCYHELDPRRFGFGPKSCSAAAHNMTIQPDGTVLPCQSWPQSVGQILTDPWPRIWNHPVCRQLRRHELALGRAQCAGCAELPLCGGGCPLEEQR